ncbi:MAG: NYN domain-containing protein [Elusimicrobia bacterium]|nr:NYN domain-containing protein [Elusimicrobiota bacterium]
MTPAVENARRNLEKQYVCFLMDMTLEKDELLRIARDIGLEFLGARPSKLEKPELLDALTEDFFKNAATAERVCGALDGRIPPLDLSFLCSKKAFRAFKASLHALGPEELARCLWPLAKESLPEAKRALEAALEVLDDRMDRMDLNEAIGNVLERSKEADELERKLKEAEQSGRRHEKRASEVEGQASDLRARLEKTKAELEEALRRSRRLEAELDEERKSSIRAAEAARLSEELAASRAELENLRADLATARQKLERRARLRRVGLFVDLMNLYLTGRELYGAGPDFKVLRQKAEECPEGNRQIVEARAYMVEDPCQEKAGLKHALREAGFEVKTRPILYRADGTAKGDWDMGMAVEILELADRLDVVVLGTGDGDFVDLVQHLKEKKPHLSIEAICFESPKHVSERLLKAVDRVVRLGPKHAARMEAPSSEGGRPPLQERAARSDIAGKS